jgi:hypothetical protein
VLWAYPGAANQQYFDPEGNWLGEAGGFNLNVVRWGDRFLVVYEGSETYFNHVNNLGSTAALTHAADPQSLVRTGLAKTRD